MMQVHFRLGVALILNKGELYMNKIALKLGKMTSREIADWMGISYNTYRNAIKQKLEELALFADFEKIYGGVIIKYIYAPYFVKGTRRNMDKTYLKLVMENDNPLDSIAGMARDLQENKRVKECMELTFDGLRYQLTKAGERTFGITKDQESVGYCGSRHYVWAIKIDDYNHYRYMNQEEEKLFYSLIEGYKESNNTPQAIAEEQLYADAWKDKEISDEEYFDYLTQKVEKDNFYSSVIAEFRDKTGEILVRATEHEVNILAAQRVMEG